MLVDGEWFYVGSNVASWRWQNFTSTITEMKINGKNEAVTGVLIAVVKTAIEVEINVYYKLWNVKKPNPNIYVGFDHIFNFENVYVRT